MSVDRSPIIGSYDSRVIGIFRQAATMSSVFSVVMGLLVLLGWAVNNEFLKSLNPQWTAMNPATAVGFVLLGLALLILTREPVPRTLRMMANGFIVFVIVIAGLKLVGYATNWNEGPDRLLFRE